MKIVMLCFHLITDNCVDVSKMRLDELWLEESRLLERSVDKNDVNNVVPDVTFTIQLKIINSSFKL